MDLIARVQGFMATKQEKLSEELARKYGVAEDELSDIVDSFLRDTYGPAIELAKAIESKECPVLLFIGRKDCTICQRSLPALERFLQGHKEFELVKLDYSDAQGLLYHMIQQQDRGMLPMIAMIFRGSIRMIFTGEGIHEEIYEKYSNELRSECSQNIYVH
ncbi:MAG: hypothetical protein A4E44_00576 [Methanosaeta sp. PtaB.Bin018]|jgi:hypothetical protein|nr:hypothetical protein [Methanothrix sp.]OPX76554.1 MAG: hypothetical protein A4E44_00576 [Methanosaeta sp. PtaB.Bin018]OPY47154.1 MAG: hypothetical protein A4E46_00601 [Methanosaeta sp. PtaU1.Bin016]